MKIFIAFYFIAHTLYWVGIKHDLPNGMVSYNYAPTNFINFQLDHKNLLTMNKKPIDRISIEKDNEVHIYIGNKKWILHYTDNIYGVDWWVEDWEYWGISATPNER